jgi:hypothetical protein
MTSADWLTLDGGGEGAATDWGHRWRYDLRDRTPWTPLLDRHAPARRRRTDGSAHTLDEGA